MSIVFETTTEELRALIVTTWPDVPAGGIWENEDLMLVPWEKVTPPIANIAVPVMPISNDWGACNEVHAGQITLTWVGPTTGDSSNQRAKAEAMRDALLLASFTYADVLDIVSIDWSNTIPVNNVFAQKGYMYRAAQVVVAVLVAAKVAT